ncbi:GGDEF domain-containing protein [Aquabacter sp. L1I39]|uniref:GGDEF domain-containing protein n=1 Tax=Aquabacter sp. L1I39 TaxID=2820278 RepID=UPI001ADA9055|nr:GGDEF domain-containing protein [Aquabacter sp. L1I39]QTL02720.1 GGDEF domain-containing protein [Aquabacter sp. L1I39]
MDQIGLRLAALHQHTPVLMAAYDGHDRLRYANAAFRAAFFLSPADAPTWAEIMRRNHGEKRGTVIRATDFEAWLVSTQARRGKTAFRAFETDLHDGRWLWMTETVQPDGWMLCIASDITTMRADERAVRQDRDFAIRAAQTDTLTGIANRRFMTERMEDVVRASSVAGRSAGCICVMDLDHFKVVNDRFGHMAGDAVLKDFAVRVLPMMRRGDSFGRVGGEEFVLVMPGTGPQEAALVAERMLATIRHSRPLPERPDFTYAFSAGITAALPDDTVISLYARADRALYAAKLHGRGRIFRDDDPVLLTQVG